MKLPLAQMLIRVPADDIFCVIIDDRPNCKDITRYVSASSALRDPVLDEYKSADVVCVSVNTNGYLTIEAMV